MRTIIRVVVLGCVLAFAAVAAAQKPSQEFIKEYQAGIDAYRLGHYDEARGHLDKARSLDASLPGPWRWLAAVAQAEEKWDECIASAREAIRLNPQSTEIVATRELHDQCRASAGKPEYPSIFEDGFGAVAITSDPAPATVKINGLSFGSTPVAPRALAVGDVTVTIEKAGYLPQTVRTAVLPGVVTDVDVTLAVDPDAKAVSDLGITTVEVTTGWIKVETTAPGAEVRVDGAPGTVDAQGRIETAAGVHDVVITAPGHETVRRSVRVSKGQLVEVKVDLRSQGDVAHKRKVGTIVISSGLVLAAVGAVTGVLSLRAGDEARNIYGVETSRPGFNSVPRADSDAIAPIHTRADMQDAVDRSKRWGLISNVSYGLAAVTVGVGAYLLVKVRPSHEARHNVAVVPLLDGHGVGAAAVGEVRW